MMSEPRQNPTGVFHKLLAEGKVNVDYQACESLDGIKLMPGISAVHVKELRDKVVIEQSDVILVSFPKCGSTWIKQVVKLIANNGVESGITHDEVIPWIEHMSLEEVQSMLSPRFFKSHLPYQLMPGGGDPANNKAKYIYVIRNPKDAAVSYYFFFLKLILPHTMKSWDDFLTEFCSSDFFVGSFYSHFLGWWQHRDAPNILIVTFEGMKRDLKAVVARVSDFLGYNLSNEVICNITEQTTFDVMKNNPAANKSDLDSLMPGTTKFMRKGVIGDWRNVFTPEQSAMMDALVEEKFGGSGLVFDYGDD